MEEIVEGASLLLSASLNKVRIQLDLKTQRSWLRGGRAQIEQMLLNLGLSVVHPGTPLHISTLPVSPQERQILSLDQASQWVELRITQNPTGNLYGGVTLDQAVVVPGDPFRIFLPLIR